VFALVHFAPDPWLIAYYLVFAVGMSLIVRATGGLEIAVLIHALNNVLLLMPAVVLSTLEESFNRDVGAAGPFALVPMAIITIITMLVVRWAPRRGVTSVAPSPPGRLPKVATRHRDPQGQRLDTVGDNVDDTLG
jgi:hypothetical protein